MANPKKVNSDLDFQKSSKLLNALLQSGTTSNLTSILTALGQLAYDTQLLRCYIRDSTGNRKLLQDNDISIDTTLGGSTPSDSVLASQKAIKAYITSLGVGLAYTPVVIDKGKSVTIASSGNSFNTGLTITNTPKGGGYVKLEVGGTTARQGNGIKTGCDYYFSSDNGVTAKLSNAVVAGDSIFWNSTLDMYCFILQPGFDVSLYYI